MRLRMLVRMRMRLWFLAPRLSLTRLSVTLCANLLLSLPPGCRPFFVLSAATCYSCSIYCVFLMSKLHFIMSLVRGKAYDRMGEKGETSSLATYARCWLLGCCWCCWLCCCGCKFYLSFNIFYALYAPPVRRLVRKQPRPATHFKWLFEYFILHTKYLPCRHVHACVYVISLPTQLAACMYVCVYK